MSDAADEYERYLRKQLAELHREYQERARPIIDALVRIEVAKPPRPIILKRDGTMEIAT